MGSHSVALISFARCNIPHVFNLCLQNQLIFDKAFQKSITISKFLISGLIVLSKYQKLELISFTELFR
ncbi:hypothetical protein B9G53_25605 [Pseudanabaena sp. SR411]|nr:hypothetical protein B9G53_25605 [Pseudanabaena sp. SR411]